MVIFVQELVTTKCFISKKDEAKIKAYAEENGIGLTDAAIELTSDGEIDMWADDEIWDIEMKDVWIYEDEE